MEVQRRQSGGRIRGLLMVRMLFAGCGHRFPSVRCSPRAGQERGSARVRIGMSVAHTGSRPSPQEDEAPATTQGTARHRSHANQRALKAPRKRRPSLAAPRRCSRCHNAPEAPRRKGPSCQSPRSRLIPFASREASGSPTPLRASLQKLLPIARCIAVPQGRASARPWVGQDCEDVAPALFFLYASLVHTTRLNFHALPA